MSTIEYEGMSDDRLSQVFAIEKARYTLDHKKRWVAPAPSLVPPTAFLPPFATDANAVLPFTTPRFGCGKTEGGGWMASAHIASGDILTAKAPTFARAACIVLLMANDADPSAHKYPIWPGKEP